MHFETMRAEVRERLGETSAYDFWPQEFIDRALNQAVRKFCAEERWPFLQAIQANVPVAAGDPAVELIDDLDLNRHMVLSLLPDGSTNDGQLVFPRRVSPETGFKMRRRYNSRGEPQFFYVAYATTNTYGGSPTPAAQALVLRLVPTPLVAYDAEYVYFQAPTGEYTDGDEPPVPEQYIEAVIAWATAMCWLKELNGSGKAQEQFNIYNAVLTGAQRDLKSFGNDEIVAWGAAEPEYPSDRFERERTFMNFPLSGS